MIRLRKLIKTRICNPSFSFMPANNQMLSSLCYFYDTGELLQGRRPTALTYRENPWWWRDKIYVPEAMRQMILEQMHKSLAAGHWGSMKRFDLLTRNFDWPNSRADLLKFCMKCKNCQSLSSTRNNDAAFNS